jgi:DNA-binding LytR/AlgR family response regulator
LLREYTEYIERRQVEMKINIEVKTDVETEILIKGDPSSSEVVELISYINEYSSGNAPNKIMLKDGEKSFIKDFDDIWYFESSANKLNAIVDNLFYSCKYKLYEVEDFKDRGFIRISKSTIVNVNKIDFIEMEFSGNYIITLKNGKRLVLSRKYVKEFKKYIEEVL